MKKLIGYGYRLKSESFKKTFDTYYGDTSRLSKSYKKVTEEINLEKKKGYVSKNAKVVVFKVIFEDCEEE